MPGNEVGDRVHNFFGQENLSQGQHHSQAGHGNWPGLNNNLFVGNQRQIGGHFISDLKNNNVQHSGINKLTSSSVGFYWLVWFSRGYVVSTEKGFCSQSLFDLI